MKITALYGPSGTGKSTVAHSFAFEQGISTIIDDGLLIHQGRKVAGYSAKYEKNYIAAVKRAIFLHDDHFREVKEAISLLVIKNILILGTSKRMVDKIAERLQLGPIDEYYTIDEVRSQKEIKMALFNRKTQEKHVIPIPYEEVDHNIFKRIIERGKKILFPHKKFIGETTIVQPNFQAGMIFISEDVFKKIIAKSCEAIKEVKSCEHVHIDLEHLPKIKVTVTLHYEPGKNIIHVIESLQREIHEDFITFFQIEPESISIVVEDLFI